MQQAIAEPKTFTAAEARTLARFFSRLESIAHSEYENDEALSLSICHLVGTLRVRIFEINDHGTFIPIRSLFEPEREIA